MILFIYMAIQFYVRKNLCLYAFNMGQYKPGRKKMQKKDLNIKQPETSLS